MPGLAGRSHTLGRVAPVGAEDTVVEIQQQKQDGADFIKIGLVGPKVFFTAIPEAKRVGLPALGHLQQGIDTAQASRAGFRSIEHLGPGGTIWAACSTQETQCAKGSVGSKQQ
jgi:hypothetical protein